MHSELPERQRPYGLIALILVQSLCAVIFLWDAVNDVRELGQAALTDWHLIVETLASFSLIVAIVFEGRALMALLRRQARIERGISIASGALHELMEEYFRSWGLTPSEEDVAAFTIKGYAISEIAQMRGSRDGTIKAHLNAIYRKAGVSGRGQLVSLLIEDLMRAPLIDDAGADKAA